ncbi:MAG: GGDEF domain-containing protein [Alteromonadaceae bacterium]|nr:MAG: GGDEF domain-containing protein [Alteromonadaceae bacterium]
MVETADSDGYREKYRQLIAEQEQAEKLFAFQLDALKKTLNIVGVAAQGLDKTLDASFAGLKDAMRGGSGEKVLQQLGHVQKAASNLERSRHDQSVQTAQDLNVVVERLLELKIPKDISSQLKSYNTGLIERLNTHCNFTQVLGELNRLQSMALDAAANPATSFWSRIKSGRTLKGDEDDGETATAEELELRPSSKSDKPGDEKVVSEKSSSEKAVSENSSVEKSSNVGGGVETLEKHLPATPAGADRYRESAGQPVPQNLDRARLNFDPGEEDNYEQVAQNIAHTLAELVDRIKPNDVVRHRLDMVRLRLKRGMDWYALSVTIEDIRDILLLRYLQNEEEFSEYLTSVNCELVAISDALKTAMVNESQRDNASSELSSNLTEQMSQMHTSVEEAKDLDQLKGRVQDHLGLIQGALDSFQFKTGSSDSLSDQLKALVDHVHSIESESKKTKELLEEERYKATHDVLTELPNREAYNEAAYKEKQRYERYGRPLTMAICDIDYFKRINDNYGHQAGDKVLRLIAKLVAKRLRKVDFAARYGGEEFVILMPETKPEQAFGVLDKIRAIIGKTPFRFKDDPVQITLSFGLAQFAKGDSVESVFERADKALYKAKNSGRNRCVIAEDIPDAAQDDSGNSDDDSA